MCELAVNHNPSCKQGFCFSMCKLAVNHNPSCKQRFCFSMCKLAVNHNPSCKQGFCFSMCKLAVNHNPSCKQGFCFSMCKLAVNHNPSCKQGFCFSMCKLAVNRKASVSLCVSLLSIIIQAVSKASVSLCVSLLSIINQAEQALHIFSYLRLCTLQVTRLEVTRVLEAGLVSFVLAVSMKSPHRFLRSNEILLPTSGTLTIPLKLTFSLQVRFLYCLSHGSIWLVKGHHIGYARWASYWVQNVGIIC